MKVSQALQELRLWERNKQWLTGGQRLADKLSYYPHIVSSYTRMVAGTKKIKYLGKAFLFDNAASPLNLQIYPYEIKQKILNNLSKKPKHILEQILPNHQEIKLAEIQNKEKQGQARFSTMVLHISHISFSNVSHDIKITHKHPKPH